MNTTNTSTALSHKLSSFGDNVFSIGTMRNYLSDSAYTSLAATLVLAGALWLLWRGTGFLSTRLDRIREAHEAASARIEWEEFVARLGVRLLWLSRWTVAIFLVWLYLSWTIVLLGARLSFVVQHARVLLRGHAPEGAGTPLGAM